MKNMDWTDCSDATIIGYFDNVSCDNIKLEGCTWYVDDKQDANFKIIYNKPKYDSSLEKVFSKKIKRLVKEENLKK